MTGSISCRKTIGNTRVKCYKNLQKQQLRVLNSNCEKSFLKTSGLRLKKLFNNLIAHSEVGQITTNTLCQKRFLPKLIIIFGSCWDVGVNADTQQNRGSGLLQNIFLQATKIARFQRFIQMKRLGK